MKSPETLLEAVKFFSDVDRCNEYMVRIKWPDGNITCPHCEASGDRIGKIETRKMLRCKDCRKQFSYKVGTIFEDSPLTLDKWFVAVWCIVNAKNGISSYELHRALGVTQKSAWFMLHRIRLAMQPGSTVYTDALKSYVGLEDAYAHDMIDHAKEYVRGDCHTNTMENFWALLKRCINGTYIAVMPWQLSRYVDEQVFRYNERKTTDGERFDEAMSRTVGRRLTYRKLCETS
jgi:transposase-like protein